MRNRKIVLASLSMLLAACGSHRTIVEKPQSVPVTPAPVVKVEAPEEVEKKQEFEKEPWVRNISRPYSITEGLQDRHLSLWASHGRYYDQEKARWKWQRPFLFCTTEDLFTQTIVVPFLMPMLENAGAYVFTPRERDWQRHEVIVDNDDPKPSFYTESHTQQKWENTDTPGFAFHSGVYEDNENPFEAGTTRKVRTSKHGGSTVSYQPNFPASGRYAVYVSYPTLPNSIDDAHYTVYHQGNKTEFRVNQRMGSGTWVYLGSFNFDKGCSIYNRVTLTNTSDNKGVVTTDAVRFGGGMGNITRGGSTSNLPRCLEAARYYAQWAGAPYSVYSSKNGENDYADDINTRSYMTNWLAGGSRYVPNLEGKHVPIELSLAIHSDAGYSSDYTSIYGSLGVCTTNFNDGLLNNGESRQLSKQFIATILDGMRKDLTHLIHKWEIRELRDANYSETRCPEIPSAILETLSHQNFPDMVYAQDPNFRFTLARSVYKSILRYMASYHQQAFTVAPLPPTHLSVEFTSAEGVTLSWQPQEDPMEPTAKPTEYVVYTAKGAGDFDNGTVVNSTACDIQLQPGVVYRFKVTALNKGGESFPSEILSALHHPGATRSIMIVNGFHRLSPPAVRETATEQGFDFNVDPGVGYGSTAGWSGKQICFDKKAIGIEGPGGLGYSGFEWQGKFLAGNTFDYVNTHAEAMRSLIRYNVASCSSQALESGQVDISKYHIVDLLLGLEKHSPQAVMPYKTFTPAMQESLTKFTQGGGALLVSGSYIGSDMRQTTDSTFLSRVLKLKYGGTVRADSDSIINGMGTTMDIYRTLNEDHYAATSTDVLQPEQPAYCAMTYSSGLPACVAYAGDDYHALTIGFPFECITSPSKRRSIMKGIINFLIDN